MSSKLDKNIKTVLKYGESLVGTKYQWWIEGDNMLDGKEPSWVLDGPAPNPNYVKKKSCNCVGLINLMRRKLNLSIPGLDKQFKYAGGTWIWFTTLKKENKLEIFDINKIYPKGTVNCRI
jgi:hypothetical protein